MNSSINDTGKNSSYSDVTRSSDNDQERQKLLKGKKKTFCQRMNIRPCGLIRFKLGIYFNGYDSYLPWWS